MDLKTAQSLMIEHQELHRALAAATKDRRRDWRSGQGREKEFVHFADKLTLHA